MRERLALWLHKTAFHLLNASDYLLEDAEIKNYLALADSEPWPTEVDNEDPRNMGESPV